MALSRAERFTMKSRILDELKEDADKWDFRRQNLLLGEFGLETLGDDWHGPSFEDCIANIPDSTLIEMYSIVAGIDLKDVENSVETGEVGNWKAGYVRLFVSHSAVHKKFIGEVADELAVVGIHGFVAHDTMAVSKPWQAQIEQALRSMQAFVAVVHPEFNASAWCQQEVGWAFGRRIPRFAIRIGSDPIGFIGSDQWPAAGGSAAKQVASVISNWISSIPELGDTVIDGLFAALETAGNYVDAGAAAERIASLGGLREDQFRRLDAIYWTNDQLYTGVLPSRALEPFYHQHGRNWPPPRPNPPAVRPQPQPAWGEPPF